MLIGNRGKILILFMGWWLCWPAALSVGGTGRMWRQNHVEGETFLLRAEVEGQEVDQLAAYGGSPRTEADPSGSVSAGPVVKIVKVQEDAEEEPGEDEPWADEPWEKGEEEIETIPDPLEPMNRVFFQFNDKLYFYVLKPVATGYKAVLPQLARVCIRNFFTNLAMPVRAVSCILQGKFEGLGKVLVRFVVNSTAGFLGFQDVAKQALDFPLQDEDLGQVFAFYGIGPGFYINLPFLGPYSLRSAVGWGGGLYVNPLNYAIDFWPNVGIRTYDLVNSTSLRIGEYEAMKDASLDPYVAMRDAYYQYRLNLIEQ